MHCTHADNDLLQAQHLCHGQAMQAAIDLDDTAMPIDRHAQPVLAQGIVETVTGHLVHIAHIGFQISQYLVRRVEQEALLMRCERPALLQQLYQIMIGLALIQRMAMRPNIADELVTLALVKIVAEEVPLAFPDKGILRLVALARFRKGFLHRQGANQLARIDMQVETLAEIVIDTAVRQPHLLDLLGQKPIGKPTLEQTILQWPDNSVFKCLTGDIGPA